MKRWFVVHTQMRAEEKALWHLTNQDFEVYLPCYLKKRSHARKVEIVKAPLFPRYLFVRLDTAADRWRSVNGTIGVSYLVTNGRQPLAVPDGLVEALREKEGADGTIPFDTPRFTPGQEIKIARGPYAELLCRFEKMADRDRVVVLLSLLGRDVKAVVALESVGPVG